MSGDTVAARPGLRERAALSWRRLRGGALSPLRAGLSVAVGLFVGAVPVYGFQLLIILAVCIPTRLDAALAYVAAHVSNPLTLPLLLLVEVEIGALLLTGQHADIASVVDPSRLGDFGVQLLVGAPTFGVALALMGGALAWTVAGRTGRADPLRRGSELTLSRYAECASKDRIYVRAKLEIDPLPRLLSTLDGDLGRLTDAGSGLGQLGILMLDLGLARAVMGFDPDLRAVTIAKAAAPEATYSVDSFETFDFAPSDTILFADTLHYVPLNVQDAALSAAARALSPGGRLVVRDVDARPGWRSLLTRLGEHVSGLVRGRRSAHAYRSTAELMAALEGLGLRPRVLPDPVQGPFDNPVVIADKPPSQASPGQLV